MAAITEAQIGELSSKLQCRIVTPTCEDYASSIRRWSDYSERPAGAVVLAETSDDVSTTLLFAKDNHIDFAVCGGGHSCSGAASSAGGIVIDLSKMRKVTVDVENRTVTAEGGCLWADVDAATAAHGFATVAGTVNHTGIGGLSLGGGWGWLTPRHGLVIDNMLSATFVLADGSTTIVSPTSHPDLFWAVRGAGQSFGVAVSFTYRVHAQPHPVWAGVMIFTPDKIDAIFTFANEFTASSTPDCALLVGFSTSPIDNAPCVAVAVYHNGPDAATLGTAKFASIIALEPYLSTVAEIPYVELNGILNGIAAHGDRKNSRGAAFKTPLSLDFAHKVYDNLISLLERVPDTQGTVILWEFVDYRIMNERSGIRDMAFANRGEYYNVGMMARWLDKALDGEVREWLNGCVDLFVHEFNRVDKVVGEGDEGVRSYANYMDPATTSGKSMFGPNLPRLIEVKRKYDPENLFHKNHAIITALAT